jgi:hypothetical protein
MQQQVHGWLHVRGCRFGAHIMPIGKGFGAHRAKCPISSCSMPFGAARRVLNLRL